MTGELPIASFRGVGHALEINRLHVVWESPSTRFERAMPALLLLCLLVPFAGCAEGKTPGSKGGPLEGTKTGQERNDNGLQTTVSVTLTKGFWLGKYELTQAEWHTLMRTRPWRQALLGSQIKEGSDIPVVNVDWHMAKEFCAKLTAEEHQSGRLPADWEYTLPTEAQWEYACRAGTTSRYSFGDEVSKLPEYAWFKDNASDVGEDYAHRVGHKKPNPWGLFDMHGNVMELCRDEYSKELPGGTDPLFHSEKPDSEKEIVFRGGSWDFFERGCRSAQRSSNWATRASSYIGFRVALVPISK
jgi:formylglycine-generating enzyme required for sulfatase activity